MPGPCVQVVAGVGKSEADLGFGVLQVLPYLLIGCPAILGWWLQIAGGGGGYRTWGQVGCDEERERANEVEAEFSPSTPSSPNPWIDFGQVELSKLSRRS